MKNRNLLIVLLAVVVLLACCCMAVAGMTAYFMLVSGPNVTRKPARTVIISTRLVTATLPTLRGTPTPPVGPENTSAPDMPETPRPGGPENPDQAPTPDAEALALQASEMPAADARELMLRLSSDVTEIPIVVHATPPSYKIGAKQEFWVSNNDNQEHWKITAELKVMTAHVAMWVEEGVRLNQRALETSAKRFEEKTYPTNREFFGSEWTPGVDNDVRLHILHAVGLGENTGGYYSSADEYSRLVNEYSNEREMFYVSAESSSAQPNSPYYDGTLAHEFQHMIHWANDRNETSWVNEGMAELAGYLNGFDSGTIGYAYAEMPDTQLNDWPEPVREHYDASYLFMTYFLDRFGEELTKAVVASPKNGIAGFNEALEQAGRPERFDDIFADWVIANYLDEPDARPDGRFGYADLDTPAMAVAESHTSYPVSDRVEVRQYGVDYIELEGEGALTIDFEGEQQVALMPTDPQGGVSWWSNRGDQSDSTLTRAFDLQGVTAATLTFSAWYDIEEGWDYAYVEVSADGGRRWEILRGRESTDENPVGNAFGPGWSGFSGGGETARWIDESVDLTPYAGKEILLRFEMVTDDAVNEPGMLIDNIAIPELGYQDDGESGAGGWEAIGWLLTDNSVQQRWLVQLLKIAGDAVTLQRMVVDADGRGQLTIPDIGELDRAVLVVSALAPVTTEPAQYSYRITQQ